MILIQDQGGERTRCYQRDRKSVYIVPASKKNEELIMVSLNQKSSKDHQFQEAHRTRRSEIVSTIMSHIEMLLSWFFWQVLSLEKAQDWKDSSQCLLVQDNEDSGEVDPLLGNQNKCESRMSKKINKIAETEKEHSRLAKPQNAVRTEQSVSKDPDSSIDLEPYINPYRLLQDSNYVLVPNK